MAKFPSQRKIMYAGAAISNGNFAETHEICLPKDLSILNRRGYASTTRKGVPLVFRVAATVYPTGLDGSGYVTNVSSDITTTVKFLGCQNNWVMKNAAVKFHAAREKMFARAGVKKAHRGAYSHEIRYGYDSYSSSFAAPVDGLGDAFAGGTWDLSDFTTEDDASFKLRLVGAGIDESSAISSIADLGIGLSYLQSRGKVADDTNLETSTLPAQFSILNDLLDDSDLSLTYKDDIVSEAQDAQDNPPYDLMAVDDTNNDITEEVELGRMNMFPQGSGGSLAQTVILDVPFGIFRVLMANRDPGDNSGIVDDLALGLEVLDIYEMQG